MHCFFCALRGFYSPRIRQMQNLLQNMLLLAALSALVTPSFAITCMSDSQGLVTSSDSLLLVMLTVVYTTTLLQELLMY
jgi:hypothetical protein